jgi:hypothetical protein
LLFGGILAGSLIGGALPASAATAVTLYVATSGSGNVCSQVDPCGSIQTALTAATGGSYNTDQVTIEVSSGTCSEIDAVSASSLSSLTIAGAGSTSTFINGHQAGTVVTITNGTVTISGLTIENGSSDGGGGIVNGGTTTLIGTTVSGNTVVGGNHAGGGIINDGPLTITDSTVSDNTAYDSAGINSTGAPVTISDSTISGNTAETRTAALQPAAPL